MTVLALFFLGLIIARPAETFRPKEKRECKFVKTRIDCVTKAKLYKLNDGGIYYEYE